MTPKEKLTEYKANESVNLHAENYLLLAKYFEDEEAIKWAERYIRAQECSASEKVLLHFRTHAHDSCNPYYYKLIKLAS